MEYRTFHKWRQGQRPSEVRAVMVGNGISARTMLRQVKSCSRLISYQNVMVTLRASLSVNVFRDMHLLDTN